MSIKWKSLTRKLCDISCPVNGKCITWKLVQLSCPRSRQYIIPEKKNISFPRSGIKFNFETLRDIVYRKWRKFN